MRLRIQTRPPLPDVKAWYSPRPNDVPSTISELKQAICRQIPALKAHGVSGSQVSLLLDDFELLDDNPLDVVRDGDLICIKILPEVSMKIEGEPEGGRIKKRKREPSMFISGRTVQSPNCRPSLPSKSVKKLPSDSYSSDESTSSTSSSSSSSTSSTSSISSSSSYSSSSSSSSSGPPVPRPSKPSSAQQPKPTVPAPPKTVAPTVPPGFGKPQTHSRNLRRRIKRMHDKQAKQQDAGPVPAPPKNSSAPNVVPLGPKKIQFKRDRDGPAGDVAAALNGAFTSNAEGGELTPGTRMDEGVDVEMEMEATSEVTQRTSTANESGGQIMMANLRNKNKRKGFKQSMAAPLPRKIVFDDNADANVASESGAASTQQVNETLMAELPGVEAVVSAAPRLVPPSEKQERGELPPRMFVTSVDVEEGMWDAAPSKKQKQKQKRKGQVQEEDYEDTVMLDMPDMQVEEDVQLDYSDMPVAKAGAPDWDRAEKGWESFVEVTDVGQLTVGTVVGWKGLALNPHTFSPELLLSIASVVRLPDPNNEGQFVVKQFPRPGGANPSLSSRLTGIVEGEEDEEMEEEEHAWNDIVDSKWRLITM